MDRFTDAVLANAKRADEIERITSEVKAFPAAAGQLLVYTRVIEGLRAEVHVALFPHGIRLAR